VDFLNTLDMDEYRNGLSEVIKYGFACNRELFGYLLENRNAIISRESQKLMDIVYECAAIKGGIVEKD
jgi:3-dehydroquinate synthase